MSLLETLLAGFHIPTQVTYAAPVFLASEVMGFQPHFAHSRFSVRLRSHMPRRPPPGRQFPKGWGSCKTGNGARSGARKGPSAPVSPRGRRETR